MPITVSTQTMQGAAGWLALVVVSPPTFNLSWGGVGATNLAVFTQNGPALNGPVGGGAGGGSVTNNWLTGSATFVLVPQDAGGNNYAPVSTLQIPAQAGLMPAPGIYLSAGVPDAIRAQLQASNPGLQVYGGNTPPPADNSTPAPWYEGSASIFGAPVPILALLGIGVGAAIFGPKLLGDRK